MPRKKHLHLFIANTASSNAALANLKKIMDSPLAENATIEVIDVTKCPELADKYNILATPTLMRVVPSPEIKLIGDLSDIEKVISILEQ